jgi:hypothetical protein
MSINNEYISIPRHDWADVSYERRRLKAQLESLNPAPKGTPHHPHRIFCTYCLSNKFKSVAGADGWQVLECGDCGSVAKIEWKEG